MINPFPNGRSSANHDKVRYFQPCNGEILKRGLFLYFRISIFLSALCCSSLILFGQKLARKLNQEWTNYYCMILAINGKRLQSKSDEIPFFMFTQENYPKIEFN